MNGGAIEVADVLASYGGQYLQKSSPSFLQRRIIEDLTACRTAALGGHRRQCEQCGYELIAYNSCRNRHCPKCQAAKQAEWMEKQQVNLLDVGYFHIVFTLPHQLSSLALQNKRQLYGLLFRCASQSLLPIAGDPKHLGAKIGITAILHTWGQTLMHHPHLHCLVPAGGLSPDGQRWIGARPGFFLPVRVLSRVFRGGYLHALHQLYEHGELTLQGGLQQLCRPNRWAEFLRQLRGIEWVVYAKPAFGSPQQVLKYLARYTHRVAISNRRLIWLGDGQVAFRYKDYRCGQRQRVMRLEGVEFIRRFLLHALPKGFVRIRHYGLLANRVRQQNLDRCRRLIGNSTAEQPTAVSSQVPPTREGQNTAAWLCPECGYGEMLLVEVLPPARAGPIMNEP